MFHNPLITNGTYIDGSPIYKTEEEIRITKDTFENVHSWLVKQMKINPIITKIGLTISSSLFFSLLYGVRLGLGTGLIAGIMLYPI